MRKTVNAAYSLIPMLLYLTYMLFMSFRFGLSFFFMALIVSVLASAFYLIGFYSLKKEDADCSVFKLFVISAVLSCALVSIALFVDDKETALIGGTAAHTVLAAVFLFAYALTKAKRRVIFDETSGKYYQITEGRRFELTAQQVKDFKIGAFATTNMHDTHHSFTDGSSLSGGSSNTGSATEVGHNYINPSSGLPMHGGMSGLDVAGNSWGTNFNDPTNHQPYDSTRGY